MTDVAMNISIQVFVGLYDISYLGNILCVKSLGHTITLGLCVIEKQALKKLQSHSFLPNVSMLLVFRISVEGWFSRLLWCSVNKNGSRW